MMKMMMVIRLELFSAVILIVYLLWVSYLLLRHIVDHPNLDYDQQ
jgi:hypothetical protein